MISREAATVATAARDRPRRRALGIGLLVVLPLVVVGGLLVWPGELAVVRLGGVSLGWWAAAASGALALLVLGFRPRPGRERGARSRSG